VTGPNILLIMTDEERYPPPYEDAATATFRREQLGARQSLRDRGVEFHRHYAGSTACTPSRATLFTGQYPSLHGVSQTDGLAKKASDGAMRWLDPDGVPTLGDWFRAGGYHTQYRGKWHVSHADLTIPGTHEGLMVSGDDGAVIAAAVHAYRRADRLDPFGFSGWIGREPHGAAMSDCGAIRDPIYAEQVLAMFDELAATPTGEPWLAVASFVNPHDIAFTGAMWDQIFAFPPPDDTVPEIPAAPSQSDSFAGRPPCQAQFTDVWSAMIYEQATDGAYRRMYHGLQKLVDVAIARVLEALDASGMADDTVVVFTSDHGDLLGAHGGMLQKWYNAYDESLRVPMVVAGAGVAPSTDGIGAPTSHVDLVPTLLGLAAIDVERAAAVVAEHHVETHPLPGRDLSAWITGSAEPVATPIYFMTEDDVSRGPNQQNLLSGVAFEPVSMPSAVESVIAPLPTGPDGAAELWKYNHYYERLDEWNAAHGVPLNPFAAPAAEPLFELHNLTTDPEERRNVIDDQSDVRAQMRVLLDAEREAKRRLPALRNA